MRRLIVLMLGLLAAATSRAEVDRAQLPGLSAGVLKIEVQRAQGGYSLGSGVVVAPERIVTNCHVTRDAVKVNVLRGGARWPAVAQRVDHEHDLCLLRVPGMQARPVALGRADPLKPGQAVTALGYTGGVTLQNSRGEVIALHRLDGARVIQSSNGFNSGASGGGLFDDDLQLVGILTFRLRGADAHYFAAPAEWVEALLDMPGDDGYTEVAPERSQRLAYWQRPVATQPRFLKAALLQRDAQWTELEALAGEWSRADSGDAEPWYLLGLALQQLDRSAEARLALECSLAIEPALAAARARLATLDARAVSGERAAAPREYRPCVDAARIRTSQGNEGPLPSSLTPSGGGRQAAAWGRSQGNEGPLPSSLTPLGGGRQAAAWVRS